MGEYYVYILSNKSEMLYTGVTSDLERRMYEHKERLIDGFAKRYQLNRLVYFETTDDVIAAILIESTNPEWKDRSEGWFGEVA